MAGQGSPVKEGGKAGGPKQDLRRAGQGWRRFMSRQALPALMRELSPSVDSDRLFPKVLSKSNHEASSLDTKLHRRDLNCI